MKNGWIAGVVAIFIVLVAVAWTTWVPRKDVSAMVPHGGNEQPLTSR